jgi:hypothetical protein
VSSVWLQRISFSHPSDHYRTPQKIVYVKVGKDQQKFGLHKDYLCFHSPYFRAAFDGNFDEATTGEVILDTTDPAVCGLFVEWLYTKDITLVISEDEALSRRESHRKEKPETTQLVRLWLLAEYLQVPQLQNKAIDIIQQKWKRSRVLNSDAVEVAYKETTAGSRLRKYFTDVICWHATSPESLSIHMKFAPREFISDLFFAERLRRLDGGLSTAPRMENYHVCEDPPKQRTDCVSSNQTPTVVRPASP